MQRLFSIFLFAFAAGCGPKPPVEISKVSAKPHAGRILTVAVVDAELAGEVRGRAKAWANRSGAKVSVVVGTPPEKVDLAIVSQGAIAGPASRGELAPVPDSITGTGKPFRWDTQFVPFQTSLVQWGSKPVAVPVIGDAWVCVYRADRFREPLAARAFRDKYKKELAAPRTWEDLFEIGDVFQQPGRPSLPPLSTDGAAALAEFHHLAACYDRAPVAAAAKSESGGAARALSFHVDLTEDRFAPRLGAPAFAAALQWYRSTAPFRPAAPGDPLKAITEGTAVVALLPLRDVAKLPKDPKTGAVSDTFGIAPMPGTRSYFDSEGKSQLAAGGRNRIPFLGERGAYGIVFQSSANSDAAWDFLAELAGPEGSASTLGESRLGGGPTRESHISTANGTAIWQRYGFDEARTKTLADAMLDYANPSVANPALPLRSPDAVEVYSIIEIQLRRAASGQATGAEAAQAAAAAWAEHDRKLDPAQLRTWRRNAAALD